MRHIIIGDIHGCFDELHELLDLAAPTSDDRIIAIGDIVDRGPDSEKVLAFFRDTPNACSIMGNHERKHIRSEQGKTRAALSQTIVRQQLHDRYGAWLAFMETFPRHIELPETILVHGMFEPGIPLEEQRDTVVIGTLTGEAYLRERCPWPWYDHYVGPKPLVVGHHHYLRTGQPLIREGLLYAIDTGCCRGFRLTALILPDFRVVSVPSRANHWNAQRRRYAVVAASAKNDLHLNWETLEAYANAVGDVSLSAEQRERAARCARIAHECEGLIEQVLTGVHEQSREILDELALAADWEACSSKKRAARYARRVNISSGHTLRKSRTTSGATSTTTPRAIANLRPTGNGSTSA